MTTDETLDVIEHQLRSLALAKLTILQQREQLGALVEVPRDDESAKAALLEALREIETIRQERDDLQKKLRSAWSERDGMQDGFNEIRQERDELLGSLQKERTVLSGQLNDAVRERNKARVEAEKLSRELADAEQHIVQLMECPSGVDKVCKELRCDLTVYDAVEAIRELRDRAATFQGRCCSIAVERDEARKERDDAIASRDAWRTWAVDVLGTEPGLSDDELRQRLSEKLSQHPYLASQEGALKLWRRWGEKIMGDKFSDDAVREHVDCDLHDHGRWRAWARLYVQHKASLRELLDEVEA
jgi:hypothetical protein